MSKIDDAIAEALSQEDAEFLSKFEKEPGSFQQIFGVFRGPFAWISILFLITVLVLFVFMIYAVWRFLDADNERGMLVWGGGALFSFLVMIVVRIWFFLEIQTNRVLREIKRVELQLARLSVK